MRYEEIKAVGISNFALYGYPILFIERDGKVYRQVFYNPMSDYGYWELKNALSYTGYINSNGNMEEWKPNRHELLLFYDLNAPDIWKDAKYLLFQKDDEYKRAIDFAKYYHRIFKDEGAEIIEKTLVVIDVSHEIKIYNARSVLDILELKKRQELNRAIEDYEDYKRWQEEQEMAKRWQFRSESNPDVVYQVKIIKYNGRKILSCNCPRWKFGKRVNGKRIVDRICPHVLAVAESEGLEDLLYKKEVEA